MLPDPTQRPTLSVEEAAELVGIGRANAYENARIYIETSGAEGLPAIRYGRSIRVPTARLLEQLGLGAHDTSEGTIDSAA